MDRFATLAMTVVEEGAKAILHSLGQFLKT
jgi:hypothetical protein